MKTIAVMIAALIVLLPVGAVDFVVEGLWLHRPPGLIAGSVIIGLCLTLIYGGVVLLTEARRALRSYGKT